MFVMKFIFVNIFRRNFFFKINISFYHKHVTYRKYLTWNKGVFLIEIQYINNVGFGLEELMMEDKPSHF